MGPLEKIAEAIGRQKRRHRVRQVTVEPVEVVSDTENVHPDDVIVVQPFYQIEPFSYYHNEDCFKKNVYYCVYTENIVFGFADYHGIEEQKKWLNNSIWLVQSYYQHFDPENSLFNDFNSSRSLISEKKFTGIEMYYFSKEK